MELAFFGALINANKQDNKQVYIPVAQESFLHTEVSVHRSLNNLLEQKQASSSLA